MTTVHTPECRQRDLEWGWFLVSHPKICKICWGLGETRSPGDWVPWGATSAQLPDNVEPCICVEDGRCPRCAKALVSRPNGWREWLRWTFKPRRVWHVGGGRLIAVDRLPLPLRCPACGWTEADPGKGRPPEPECLCWESQDSSEGGYIWSE